MWTKALTIEQRLGTRDNNFDLVRLLAAFAVLLSHSWPLLGRGDREPIARWLGHDTLGSLAVGVFFVISGFLVAGSYLNDRHPGRFLARRGLRLYPGLVVNVLLCVLVLGPLATSLPLGDYFRDPHTWKYLRNAEALRVHYSLPGLFQHNPLPQATNGSLWTLRSEINLYLVLLLLGMCRLLRPSVLLTLLPAILVTQYFLLGRYISPTTRIAGLRLDLSLPHAAYFCTGAIFYVLRHRLPLHWSWAALCLAAMALSVGRAHGDIVFRTLLPYVVIYACLLPLPLVSGLRRLGDISYGVYLYAFPVQQTVVSFTGPGIPLALYAGLCALITVGLGILSWWLIEHRALSLKHYLHPPRKQQAVQTAAEVTAAG